MKLAEALQLRADTQRRIEQLQARLVSNALVQEGEKPGEEPTLLFDELEECLAQLEQLMAQINRANCETQTPQGTLTQLLARRDCMAKRIIAYRAYLAEASSTTRRAKHTEIKVISTLPVHETQKKCDDLSRAMRELDVLIQGTNWTTELE